MIILLICYRELRVYFLRIKKVCFLTIDRFRSLSIEERANFRIGRRLGIYVRLSDLNDEYKRRIVEQTKYKLTQGSGQLDEKKIHTLMEGFVLWVA
ncbi:hypothetical protein ACFLTP_10050 [Chloroflexota bacterium]